MNHFEHIQKTFSLEHLPANIRASRFFARWPFIRRYQNWPVGLGFLNADGRFSYQGNGPARQIRFNGRNLQFHALYESSYRHGYELETALLISMLCRGNAPFFDIGSNWGYFSLLAASLPEFTGPIYAFEPNPGTFADLVSTIKQAGVTDRVTACNMGAGQMACEMTVTEADRFNTGISRLTADGTGHKIPVKPLDALEFGRPGFIKIDAEGMEAQILAGATRTMAEVKPFVMIENILEYGAPEKTYEAIEVLKKNHYQVFVPVLEFSVNGSPVLATYRRDYTPLVASGGQPKLGLVEFSAGRRFLLGEHLNLLGVHTTRIEELWRPGIANLGKI